MDKRPKDKHLRRWERLSSWPAIVCAGLEIYGAAQLIYAAWHLIPGTGYESPLELFTGFPRIFLLWTLPFFLGLTIFLFLSNVRLIKKEGFGPKKLLGTAFGLVWIGCIFLARLAVFPSILMCYLTCMFFGTCLVSLFVVKHRPRMDNDFLIILGCYIGAHGKLLPLLRMRMNRAIRFAWEQEIAGGKSICYVPSGGQGPDEIMSEASAMEMYLLSHSAEQYEVMAEKKSRNTYENFDFSRRLIEERKKDAIVTFITTNYHVLRSAMIARKVGLHAEGLASGTRWYFWPNGFVREFVAILALYKRAQILAGIVCVLISVLVFWVEGMM